MERFYMVTCWLYNHKGPSFVVHLRESKDGFTLLRQDETSSHIREIRDRGVVDLKQPYRESFVASSVVMPLIDRLGRESFGAVPEMTGGFDGCTYHVRVRNGQSEAHYSWWLDAPESWFPLQKFWNDMVALSGEARDA